MDNERAKINNQEKKKKSCSEFSEARINRIKCPIFCYKNQSMESYTGAINEEKNIQKKAYLAACLIREADALLTCQYVNKRKIDCRICQKISEIRKKTAELIVKAQELKSFVSEDKPKGAV